MYKLLFIMLVSLFIYSCNNSNLDNENIVNLDSDTILKTSNHSLSNAILKRDYRLNLKVDSNLIADEYLIYDGELPDGLTLDSQTGVITGTPQKSGDFKFKLGLKNSDSEDIKIIPLNISVDNFMSLYKNIEGFIDISKTSNSTLHPINNGEIISFSKPLFYFYGNLVSSLTVCKDGYLKVNGGSCNPATDIDGTNDVIAPFADAFTLTNESQIYYQIRDKSPRSMLIVQFKNLERTGDIGSKYNFEVIIHEDSNNIQFLYDISSPGSNANANDKAHLGSHAFVGVTTSNKKYEVIKNQPKIFRGTVITLHAPAANTTGNYNEGVKWLNHKYITSNIVSDYVDIARYNKDAATCTQNSDCPISNKCIVGYAGQRCAAQDLTDILLYDTNFQFRLPFDFNFYGNTYTDFYLTENGYMYFGPKNNSNIVFPKKSLPNQDNSVHLSSIPVNNSILPMFSDINLKSTMGGHITYNVIGEAPNRRAVIMFDEVRIMDERVVANTIFNTLHNCTFELVLHEDSNVIEFLYSGGNESDVCLGRASTVGLKKDNNDFIEISANNPVLGQGKSITFVPNDKNATSYTWVGVGNDKPDNRFPNSKEPGIRSIYLDEINQSFVDIPLRDLELHPVPEDFGEDIEKLYLNGTGMDTYKIYDLDNANGSGYQFEFKGKTYNKLFIDGNGAVSFGNENTAEMIIAPMWGDVYTQSELESLKSPYEDVENDFMWIANSGDGTLSKINTHTGVLIGNYDVGDSPSRTAVGFDGAVWVGNRNSHDVTKLDRYGNFVCEVDLNWGCGPRALALDRDENLWVGCYYGDALGRKYIYKIADTKIEPSADNNYAPRCRMLDIRASGDTSSNLAFKNNYYGTYGFAFDKHGILWSSKLSYDRIIRIDTNKTPGTAGFYESFTMPARTYGLVVDYDDNIWHARYDGGGPANTGVFKTIYNPTTHTISTTAYPIKDNTTNNGRGVAIDRNGNIWVAYSNSNKVGKFAPDGTALAVFPLNGNLKSDSTVGTNCTSPIGIGVDGDGDVWANCRSTGNSEELDANSGIEKNNFATGPSPYCYSDNTGFSLRNVTSYLKKTKFTVKTAKYKVYNPSNPTECIRIERKLIVQWDNVRMKKVDVNGNPLGYTETTFEIIFDNGRSFTSNTPGNKCDETNLHEEFGNRDVTITYVYGGVRGSDYDLKTGANTETTLRAIYAVDENNLQYEHVIGERDAGTVNSGSKFVISSGK